MRKLLQLKLYSFLSSRWGMTFCVVGLFVTLNTFFQIVQLLLNTNSGPAVDGEWRDNLSGVSQRHIMSTEPIDVVYTWVNGSDLRHIQLPHCNATQTADKDFCWIDEDTQSRFIDNEELRYSLRSLEAFAPWVRHIYIVTNGQIPYWLNLDDPRLTIITHEEIFVNKSHLPTFSSPSIETHIHRIPNLSSKFIYLNDDVMFGRDIYPDDFFTHNSGQKVFLSWPVPNCAEGCPSNWIGDGYCDLACNVSVCDFDLHDCDNYTGIGSGGSRWWTPSYSSPTYSDISSRYKNYCAKGCPDTWIGDKYCDRMCKNEECGFDGGDCGVEEIFSSMHGVQITWDTTFIELPPGLPSVYFNLSDIVHSDTITDGSHDNAELVRTATISQKHKIMTLTFHRNISMQDVMLSITAEHGEGENKTVIEKTFNLTLDTTIIPPPFNDSALSNETQDGLLPTMPLDQPQMFPDIQIHSPDDQEDTHQNNTLAVIPKAGANDFQEEPLNTGDTKHIEHKKADNTTKGKGRIADFMLDTNDSNTIEAKDEAVALTINIDANLAVAEGVDLADFAIKSADVLVEESDAGDTEKGKTRTVDQNDVTDTENHKTEVKINLEEQDTSGDVNDINAGKGHNTEDAKSVLLTEQRPVNDGSVVKKDGGGEVPNQILPNKANEISSDPVGQDIKDDSDPGGAGIRKLLSIPIDDTESGDDYRRLQWEEVVSRKKEQLHNMELERAMDTEREHLLRINKDYEATLFKNNEEQGKPVNMWPWERQRQLDTVREMHGGGRRLLDMYGDSLKHVNKLYNHAFGPSARKVPAHMPHMIDKAIMEELQARWPEEWDETSTHSLRHPQDMQYAFAYFYYLIHARVDYNFTEVWEKELDVDGDGRLNDNELRTLGVHLYGVPLKSSSLSELKERLLNVCIALYPGYLYQRMEPKTDALSSGEDTPLKIPECPITPHVLDACNKTSEEVRKIFSKKLKYRHQLDGTDDVAFLMVGNNHTVMEGKLDGVRVRRQRFICLNDNINHSNSDTVLVVKVLHDFYMSILPKRSSFELPPNTRNTYSYIEDVRAAREAAAQHHRYIIIVGTISISTLLCVVYKCFTYASRADRRARERRATRFLNT